MLEIRPLSCYSMAGRPLPRADAGHDAVNHALNHAGCNYAGRRIIIGTIEIMSKLSPQLAAETDPAWAGYILEHFDAFLIDHANCERKASALAMSFVIKYADRTRIIPPLIALAQEELVHFQQVYAVMIARGLQLAPDQKDPYVNALLALCHSGRERRFLDRLLVSSLVETRGAERFRLIHLALDDPELKSFYRTLWACEAKHGNQFAEMALEYFPPEQVSERLGELVAREAEIVASLPWRPSLH